MKNLNIGKYECQKGGRLLDRDSYDALNIMYEALKLYVEEILA